MPKIILKRKDVIKSRSDWIPASKVMLAAARLCDRYCRRHSVEFEFPEGGRIPPDIFWQHYGLAYLVRPFKNMSSPLLIDFDLPMDVKDDGGILRLNWREPSLEKTKALLTLLAFRLSIHGFITMIRDVVYADEPDRKTFPIQELLRYDGVFGQVNVVPINMKGVEPKKGKRWGEMEYDLLSSVLEKGESKEHKYDMDHKNDLARKEIDKGKSISN